MKKLKQKNNRLKLKGTVKEISSDPPCKDSQ